MNELYDDSDHAMARFIVIVSPLHYLQSIHLSMGMGLT